MYKKHYIAKGLLRQKVFGEDSSPAGFVRNKLWKYTQARDTKEMCPSLNLPS